MPKRHTKKSRNSSRGLLSMLPGQALVSSLPQRGAKISVPFSYILTMTGSAGSVYTINLHPNNIGGSHIQYIADCYGFYRYTKLNITLLPCAVPSFLAYSTDLNTTVSSVTQLSQLANFVFQPISSTYPATLAMTRASMLSESNYKWFNTNTGGTATYQGLIQQGLISGTPSSQYVWYRGVIEFCQPTSFGYQLTQQPSIQQDPIENPVHVSRRDLNEAYEEKHFAPLPLVRQGTGMVKLPK
jgi:hypothetical protein